MVPFSLSFKLDFLLLFVDAVVNKGGDESVGKGDGKNC